MPLYNLPSAGAATANLIGPASISTTGDAGTHALDFVQNSAALGPFNGLSRTYFGRFSQLESQAWMCISGAFNESSFDPTLAANQIQVIYPGANRGNPTLNVGSRINAYQNGMLGISNDIVGPNLLLQDNHLSISASVAVGAAPVAGGAGYTVGDVLTVATGTPIPVTATIYDSVQLNGSGYSVNDILTVVGGVGTPATLRVTAVAIAAIPSNGLAASIASGGILAATLLTPGAYSVLPSITTNVTGGTGSGAYVNMIWPTKGPTVLTVTAVAGGAIAALSIARPGAYVSPPAGTVALTGGTGSGATATAIWSANATLSRHIEVLDSSKAIRWHMRGDGTQVWGNAQDIDLFVASNADIYGIDNNNLGTHATFNAPSLNISGNSQLGNVATYPATRTVAATAGSTTAIGSFALTDPASGGSGSMRIMLNMFGAGLSTSKIFDLVTSYNQTSGVWQQLVPVASVLQSATTADHAIDAMVSSSVLSLRLRNVSATVAVRAEVSLLVNGPAANAVFLPSLTTATGVSAPTAFFPGQLPPLQDRVVKSIASGATNGATLTIPLGAPYYLVNPGLAVGVAALPSLVVTFPANPVEGQRQSICFGQSVTGLYLTGPNAQYGWTNGSAVAQYQKLEYTFHAATTQWYRTL